MRRAILSVLALLLVASPSQALQSGPESNDAERVARAYLAAYDVLDLAAMERFISEDIVFVDSTNPRNESSPNGTYIEGRKLLLLRSGRSLTPWA